MDVVQLWCMLQLPERKTTEEAHNAIHFTAQVIRGLNALARVPSTDWNKTEACCSQTKCGDLQLAISAVESLSSDCRWTHKQSVHLQQAYKYIQILSSEIMSTCCTWPNWQDGARHVLHHMLEFCTWSGPAQLRIQSQPVRSSLECLWRFHQSQKCSTSPVVVHGTCNVSQTLQSIHEPLWMVHDVISWRGFRI